MIEDRYNSDDWKSWEGPKLSIPDTIFKGISTYDLVAKEKKELENNARHLFSKASIFTRTTVKGLQGILDDGRLKNQFETGYSKGSYDLKSRREAELHIMGVPIRRQYKKRPIYGYLSDDFAVAATNHYGEIVIKFKDNLRNRSTFTANDSLHGVGRLLASPIDAPSYRSWSKYDSSKALKITVDNHPQDMSWQYVEVQIHDGVALSDIEYIHSHSIFDETTLAFCEKAKKMGIKVVK